MIQRIQSLYLSLTILFSLLLMNGGFLRFIDTSGTVIEITFKGLLRNSIGEGYDLIGRFLPLSGFMIIIPSLSLIAIFLYKNRTIQLWFASSIIIMATLFIIISVYYSYNVWSTYDASIIAGYKMVIPVLILIFSVLAYRGIRKDDRLVKSYDRLR